jgi:peroxiredoxin
MLPSLWILALGSALAGPPKPSVTVFSGHLDHAPAGDSVRLFMDAGEVKAPLSASGDFRFEFKDLKQNTPTRFSYARQRTELYLMPGDQLVMHLDFKDFDKTLTYSGRGSEVNNYLAQALYKYSYGPDSGLLRIQEFPKGTPAEAVQAAGALRQARREFLASYAKAHPLPASFRRDEQAAIDITWATMQLAYAAQHSEENLPDDYFDFIAATPVRELNQHYGRSFLDNSLLANFVMGYQYRLVPGGKFSTDPTEGRRIYQTATAELGDTKARSWALRNLIFDNIRRNTAGAQAFYPTFRQYNRDSALAREVRKAFALRLSMSEGKPAPGFTLTDHTGKKVSLSDLRGKVVYLDFWGTWCGPCMKEMTESAPALKKKFEGRDVVFLYISVGDPEAKWQQTLTEKQFTSPNSMHLRSTTDNEAIAYQVDGYPSYYLIDREGRFVQVYTSRPSEGDKTVAAIEQALAR